jgi:hypothetical protein
MYHVTSSRNRASIQERGLDVIEQDRQQQE